MGLIQAFTGAIGGMFADQWLDFITVPEGIAPTAALFPGVRQGQNAGRGSNVRGSEAVITNGSRILIPQGYGLITLENGAVTNFAATPGGYEFRSDAQDSTTIFLDGFVSPTIKTSWERFKFGGRPSAQQIALFVNLKEITGNRFGTQSEIYWDDAYLGAQVGAVTRGTYTLQIIDPILFVTNLVPASYLTGERVFDFTDQSNPVADQLFSELVGSLSPAFSKYTNDPSMGNRITRIQQDSIGFAQSLSAAVEENYQWQSRAGLYIPSVSIVAIEYDERTRELLTDVQKADALSGSRGNSFLQQATARGVQAAGENGGGDGLAMFGMGAGMAGGLANFQQPAYQQPGQGVPQQGAPGQPQQGQPQQGEAPQQGDVREQLQQYKSMLDDGLISEEDFQAVKKRLLGI